MRWSTNQQAGSSKQATTADEGEESQFEIRTRTQSQVQRGLINALCRATRKLTLHALTLDKRRSWAAEQRRAATMRRASQPDSA